ncbi:MAG TPA: hypothetical protein DEF07_09995 [Nitrosomonas sp.]|nr:hypothetical protein [Nitrosomonas sp.]
MLAVFRVDNFTRNMDSTGFQQRPAENSACLGVKNIGKPCAVVAHARFNEEGLVKSTMEWL